jgi:nitroreductase
MLTCIILQNIAEGFAMSTPMVSHECNRALDEVLESRRSIRSFKPEIPPKDLVKDVLRAGILAPFAAAALEGKDFRRFVVVARDSPVTARIADLVKRRAAAISIGLKEGLLRDPELNEKARRFARRLEEVSLQGVPSIGAAPYFIVAAERKGFPPVEHWSLAHSLENMWLKATALGLGFQLISLTAELAQDKEFCDLLGIPYGEFELNGCAIGYPAEKPAPVWRPNVDEITKWID